MRAHTHARRARQPSPVLRVFVYVSVFNEDGLIYSPKHPPRPPSPAPPHWLTDRKPRLPTDSIRYRARSRRSELKGSAQRQIHRKRIQLCPIALCAQNNLSESSPPQYFLRSSLHIHEAKCDKWTGWTQPSLRPFSPSASPLVCMCNDASIRCFFSSNSEIQNSWLQCHMLPFMGSVSDRSNR